ncbi:MAG: hypothetical protein U0176_23475 [Bacteroidia bacterium]
MRKWFPVLLPALLFVITTVGCTTDFEVYEDPKEIRAVYCVLNPRDTAQYVRIAKAYQVQGDAIEYAANNDLSVKGLQVKLKAGNKTWTATEVAGIPKEPGTFNSPYTVYRFLTDDSPGHDTLAWNTEYTLEVGTPESDDYVTGKTWIPEIPKFRGDLNLNPGPGNQLCLPKLFLDRRYSIFWKRLGDGINYEVRVGFVFQNLGVQDTVLWGPTNLFDNTDSRCTSAECGYTWNAKELLRVFYREMPDAPPGTYTYNDADSCAPANQLGILPRSLWFEVTAVDKYLSTYMIVNDPSVLDLNGSKPEYTNLSGKVDCIGVFGSYLTDRRYAILQTCSQALLGLNGIQAPLGCEW